MQDSFDKYVSGEKRTGLLIFLVISLVVFFNPYEKTFESILLSLVIILISFFPFILWRRNKHRNLVIPGIIWYFSFHMIGYGVVGFIAHETGLGINIEGQWVEDLNKEKEVVAKLLVALHLIIVLVSVYCLKYFFPDKNSSKQLKQTYSNLQFKFSIYACLFFLLMMFGRVTNIFPWNNLLTNLAGFFSFMYLFYFLFYLNYGHWTLKLAAVIGCVIIRGALLGPSIGPYAEVGIILLLIRLQKGKIPIAPVGVLILAFILYQPMKGTVRIMFDKGDYGIAESLVTGFETLDVDDTLQIIDIATKRIDYNLLLTSFIDNIGVANSSDFLGWKGYENLPYTVIPRALFPSKPFDDFANAWAVQEGYLATNDYETSYNLPWVNQMYLSFGSQGIIIGAFIVAVLLFFLERFYWTMQPNAWSFAVGYSIIRALIYLETDFSMSFGMVIKIILVDIFMGFIFKLLRATKSKKEVSYQ
jgi:hypothetical protein